VKGLNIIALALIIIGGVNWGLVGLFDFDLVGAIFGNSATVGDRSALSRIIYILVGLAALWGIYLYKPLTSHADR
jgi:uncharacterized membrane protein YuzA (DUF378 family)